MKKSLMAAALSATLFGGLAEAGEPFRLASYNVRFPYDDQPLHMWSNRVDALIDTIRRHQFDLFGVQELTWPGYAADMAGRLADEYSLFGSGRLADPNDKTVGTGEGTGIFWRRSRFDFVKGGHFMLSKTPDVIGSTAWNAGCPRVANWAIFKDRRDGGRAFVYVNTHMDCREGEVRLREMEVILAQIDKVAPGLPAFLTGDLNAIPTTPEIKLAKTRFASAWEVSKNGVRGPWRTWNGWKYVDPAEDPETAPTGPEAVITERGVCVPIHRIDYLFVPQKGVTVRNAAVHTDTFKGPNYPSDHFPVSCDVSFDASATVALKATTPCAQNAWWCRSWVDRTVCAARDTPYYRDAKVVFLGDSITDFFRPYGTYAGASVWTNWFGRKGDLFALNYGISGDRTEHVLWRLKTGFLDGTSAKVFVVMIGTNNIGQRPEDEEPVGDTILGVREIVLELRRRYPDVKVLLHPIFPRAVGTHEAERFRVELVNHELRHLADGKNVFWLDFNSRLLAKNGRYEPAMSKDALHPLEPGYRIWAEELVPRLRQLLGEKDVALPPPCPPTPKHPAIAWLDAETNSPAMPKLAFGYLGRIREKRDQIAVNQSAGGIFDLVMVGDSITHNWESAGKAVRATALAKYTVLNAGFGGTGTQHMLWNLKYGGLADGYSARAVTVMIGTNNFGGPQDTVEDVAEGVFQTLCLARSKQAAATIIYHPILPRGAKDDPHRAFIAKVNALVAEKIADKGNAATSLRRRLVTVDLSEKFANPDGSLVADLYQPDQLHLSEKGYQVWAEAILPTLGKACLK